MKRIIFTFTIFAFLFACQSKKTTENTSSTLTYTNPIIDRYMADPNMVFENGYYYLINSHESDDGRYLPIHKSKDLVNWEFIRGAVEKGDSISWNYENFWAPEVIKIDGFYYLYYTASPGTTPGNTGNHVGLAIADNIEGPYEDVGRVLPHSSIDGHPFIDDDGTMYMYYTIEYGNIDSLTAGQIYVDKMLSPTEVAGNPVQLISHHKWQEGPWILKRNRKYFLTYSVGGWDGPTYHVRYAIGENPMGPFEEQQNKILETNEVVKGPGHHSLFQAYGKNWIVYHGWDTAYTARYPRLDLIEVEGNKIISDGPTFTEQTVEID